MISTSLIQACLKKDDKAYKELYELSISYVYSIVKRYISSHEEQKDVTQNIYAKVFQKLYMYDSSKGEFKYWLRKIAVNDCLMVLRKSANMKMFPLDTIVENSLVVNNDHLDQLTRNDIIKLLKNMPVRYKMVFIAYIIDGYNHTEIGEMLDITKDTSRSQLSRAKKWIIKNIATNKKYKFYGQF